MSRRFSFLRKKAAAAEAMLLPAGTPIITPYGAGKVQCMTNGIYKIALGWHLAQGQAAVLHAAAAHVESGKDASGASGLFVHKYRPSPSRELAPGAPIKTPYGDGTVKGLENATYAVALDWKLAQGQNAMLYCSQPEVESGEGPAGSSGVFEHEHTREKAAELAPGTAVLTPYGPGQVRGLAGGKYEIALAWHAFSRQQCLCTAGQAWR